MYPTSIKSEGLTDDSLVMKKTNLLKGFCQGRGLLESLLVLSDLVRPD